MIQRSKSKTIAKIKYLVIVPLMLVMLIFVACSDSLMPASESNLEEYSYTLVKGEEKSSEMAAKRYEAFLAENPDYVGWRIVDHENETVEYSIHSKDEKVPADFKGYISILPGGEESMRYVKEIRADVNTTVDIQNYKKDMGLADVPFAVVEEVPIYPGCEDLSSNVEKKDCMTENVSKYVTTNFNTALGKQLDLEGVIRIIAVFKINPEGKVTEVRARAPHPDLEAEAIRVISSLPEMTPGKHNGKEVGVSYSLPIVFQVNKQESK